MKDIKNPFEKHTKRYNDFNSFLRRAFGARVHKISIDAGLNCPNRDGTISSNGCIFCNKRGSGTGAWEKGVSIREQVLRAQEYLRQRFKAKKFLAYFQSFSNTYASKAKLELIYKEALNARDMVGICIGTRPDCVPDDILDMIACFITDYMVWMEYGLQSIHDRSLLAINRGHSAGQFLDAVDRTRKRGINVCAHIILGLPGETKEDMLQTADQISKLDIQGVKIHLLYVIKDTPLANLYARGEYKCLTQEEYLEILISFLKHLRKDIIIQRLTGDPHPEDLLAPGWSLKKNEVLKLLQEKMEKEDIWQGNEQTII
ncbi:MAG: TIGR01212 family radical SAM protein [bacterium]